MEKQYNDIKEYLRKQHNANLNEVRVRYHNNGYVYHYDEYNGDIEQVDRGKRISGSSDSLFVFKIIVFLVAVFSFSFYIYGGQDLEKGAKMAWRDVNAEIVKLENNNETVKETMGYVRNAWHRVKDFAGEYMDE